MDRAFLRAAAILSLTAVAGCSGGGSSPVPSGPPAPPPGTGVFDASTAACTVSYDGIITYNVPAGPFSPVDITKSTCGSGALTRNAAPPIPRWAHPNGKVQAIFVATSLQQNAFSQSGMETMESAAASQHVPMTWLLLNDEYLMLKNLYNSYHAGNGDDIAATPNQTVIQEVRNAFAWWTPHVSAEGAGRERTIAADLSFGETGFWGITWNSHGVDGTYDEGAPWGTYCADVSSYKRPSPDGSCTMLAFEWTARDLTRAYLSGHEEYFSTDPDDMQQRAQFSVSGAEQYARELVDAYAAASETQPLVMVSQEETNEAVNSGNPQILEALYARAKADGMKAETLSQANDDARVFSALPRAVAFPYIPGGRNVPSIINGQTLYPATIDYHDNTAGMTFLSGHTLPERVFPYADDPVSRYNVPLVQLPSSQMPKLLKAAVSGGSLALEFKAPVALHFGIALWTNPSALGLSGANVTPAGHAGAVITFDLQQGTNEVTVPCAKCTGTTFPYAT